MIVDRQEKNSVIYLVFRFPDIGELINLLIKLNDNEQATAIANVW